MDKMAAVSQKGPYGVGNLLGNEISCTIAPDKTYTGNVAVFDSHLKAVVINRELESDNQVHLINLNNVKSVDVTKTSSQQTDNRYVFHRIDLAKVSKRYEDAVRERKQEFMRIGDGVSPEAQTLFDKLASV